MFDFRQGSKRADLGPRGGTAERLSPGVSIIVIAALSALAWAALIALAMGVTSLL